MTASSILTRLAAAGLLENKDLASTLPPANSLPGSPQGSLAGPEVTPASEPGEVTSGQLESLEKRSAPRCAATNKHGEPCRAYPSLGTAFCLMHNPGRAEHVQEARRQGGRHRAPYQFAPALEVNFEKLDLSLVTPLGLQGALEAILRMVLLGRIPRQHAAIVMRFLEVASANLRRIRHPSDHNWDYYYQHVHSILFAADLIEEHLQDQHTQERAESLADLRARLEERFRTEDEWRRAPKKP